MATYRTEALVLRSRPYSEGHRLLTIYSPERGKYTVIARGVDKPRSKLAAGSQPFSHSEFLCWEGRSLDGVRQAEPIHGFRTLREDLDAMSAASFVAELVDRLAQPEDADPELFAFLLAAFSLLENTDDLELGVRYIEWHLLDRMGFRPLLRQCVNCGTPLGAAAEPWQLGLREGGLLCTNCGHPRGSRGPELSVGAARTILQLLRSHPARLHILKLSHSVRRELAGVGEAYLEYILERPLRSRDFMEKLFEMGEQS